MAVSAVNGIFKGIVVDDIDPEGFGRVQVRIPSIHGPSDPNTTYEILDGLPVSLTYTATSELPWAPIMTTPDNPGGAVNYKIGTIVYVMASGGSLQHPVIIGSSGTCIAEPSVNGSTVTDEYSAGSSNNGSVKSGNILGVPANRKVLAHGNHKCTSPYGPRWGTIHGGIDLVGTGSHVVDNVTAFAAGTIEIKKYSTSYGNYILLRHEGGYKTVYAHMHHFITKKGVGDRVAAQEVLGLMGTTGHSTGNHLHFEVRHPLVKTNQGRIDPAPYLQGTKSF